MNQPLTADQLDDIEARAAHLTEYATLTDKPLQADADQLTGTDVPALLAEIRRLRTETARRVQCNDCGAVGEVFTGDDGLAYLDPSGQIGHGPAAPAEGGEQMRVR
jgi:hypothetical protein